MPFAGSPPVGKERLGARRFVEATGRGARLRPPYFDSIDRHFGTRFVSICAKPIEAPGFWRVFGFGRTFRLKR